MAQRLLVDLWWIFVGVIFLAVVVLSALFILAGVAWTIFRVFRWIGRLKDSFTDSGIDYYGRKY